MYDLADYAGESARCSRCGACATFCPVYLASLEETLLARGKLHLSEAVLKGEIALSSETEKRLNACLLCGACTTGCPSGVPCDEIILAARKEAVKKHGLPFLKDLSFKYIISNPWRFNLGIRSLALLQNYLSPDKESGPAYRHLPFSFSGVSKDVAIPMIADHSLSKTWHDFKVKKPQARVAFFHGCLFEYVYPEVGLSLQRLLTRLNIEVVRPRQVCCSSPVIASGETEVAKKIARENVNSFLRYGDFDYIVTACATCGAALKNLYPKLLEDSDVDVEDFSNNVLDINEFLLNHTNVTDFLGDFRGKVTYHDPCHLNRYQKINREPRQLILASGAELKEMRDADRCCGSGGTFALNYPDLSEEILKQKMQCVEETAAEYLVTTCPGCLMQLRRGVKKTQLPLKTLHVVELLEQAFSKKG